MSIVSEAFGCWKCASLNLSHHMREMCHGLIHVYFLNKCMRALIKIAAVTLVFCIHPYVCVCVSKETFVQGFLKFTSCHTQIWYYLCIRLISVSKLAKCWETFQVIQKSRSFSGHAKASLPKGINDNRYVFISQSNNLLGHSRSACFLLYSKNISNRGILSWQQTKCHKTLLVKYRKYTDLHMQSKLLHNAKVFFSI